MKLSVALCTYSGERFLPGQLRSLGGQTRPPDEVVVCDDASADRSAEIVREFAATAPFPVRVVVSDANRGSTPNFEQAIRLCTGDAIVLADQDDVWLPHKLAALELALKRSPDAGFVFSDAEVVDEAMSPFGYTLWEAIRFGTREQDRFRHGAAFEALLRRYRVTGATMAFRAEFRDLVLPIPAGWVHDAWIALLIAAVAGCELVPELLIRYRQHAGQQHGGARRGLHAQYLAAMTLTRETCETVAERYEAALDRLIVDPRVRADRLKLLRRKVAFHRERAAMRAPGAWRLPRVARELRRGHYHRFALGWKAAAQDLFLR